jgi:hypothetical protein
MQVQKSKMDKQKADGRKLQFSAEWGIPNIQEPSKEETMRND